MPESQLVAIDRLQEAPWNANRVRPAMLAKIRRSLEEFGVVENLVARPVGGGLEVLSGNHRLRLLQEMGATEVPVVVVDLDDAHARILAQTLNRTRGADDPEAYARLLERVLSDLPASTVIEYLPETEGSIDRLLRDWSPENLDDPDEAPPTPARPKSRTGRVYELGPHRLVCGDASNPEHIAALFAGAQAAAMLTDPPYGVAYGEKTRKLAGKSKAKAREDIAGDGLDDDALEQLLAGAFSAVGAYSIPGAPFYVFHADRTREIFTQALEQSGWLHRQTLIWVKNAHVVGRQDYQWKHEPILYGWRAGGAHRWFGDQSEPTVIDDEPDPRKLSKAELVHLVDELRNRERSTVLRQNRPNASELHPTMKPVGLLRHYVLNSSAPGDIICDPFAGSGSTLIACEQAGRRCFAVELDAGYCDVIRTRYDLLSGG